MNTDQAVEAILAHHRTLVSRVESRVATLVDSVPTEGHAAPLASLVAYLAEEVLPHALAEEQTLYREAATRPGLGMTVAGLSTEHQQLAAAIDLLATAPDRREAVKWAHTVAQLFASHVTRENELVLSSLAGDSTVDLPAILRAMQTLTEPRPEQSAPAADVTAALLALLLKGTTALASAGKGEAACTLAASAWATLRAPRPDLAHQVTRELHHLVKLASQPGPQDVKPDRVQNPAMEPQLDVRTLVPAQRHDSIFETYRDLDAGTGFVLVNDHDPKPLRYQFEAEHRGEFTWEYLEAGPRVWKVRIGRTVLPSGRTVSGPE